MTHTNRGRLTVDLGGKWRLYTNTLPANSLALGIITRDGYDTGALVQIETTGLYVQVNAGAIRSLPQAKIIAYMYSVGNDIRSTRQGARACFKLSDTNQAGLSKLAIWEERKQSQHSTAIRPLAHIAPYRQLKQH